MTSSPPTDPKTELYFVRHGIAFERGTYANDDERPLTQKGKVRTQQVAQRLKSLGCDVDCILTSPLVRARQTANLLLAAGVSDAMQIEDELAPGGSLEHWLAWLAEWQTDHPASRLALVGHEPDLSNWAQELVVGQRSDRWLLKKAGVIGVQVAEAQAAIGTSVLFWFAPPRLLL